MKPPMQGKPRVLVIDDEYKTLDLLGMRLQQDGFEVTRATSGKMGLKLAYENHPDAILLDIMMPGMDGLQACRRLREVTDAVIIFLSVKSSPEDIIRGLHMGADDYIPKPYNYQELLARLSAALRRRDDSKLPPLRLQQGEAVLIADSSRRLVFVNDGRSVQLTPKEFALLRFLVKNRGKVMSADEILINVWGLEYKGERDLVKQFIYRLRNKLESDPSKPEYIVTVRGSGYAFEEDTKPRRKPAEDKPRTIPKPVTLPVQPIQPLLVPEQREPQTWAAEPVSGRAAVSKRDRSAPLLEQPTERRKWAWLRQAAMALLLVVAISFGLAYASGYALPRDPLFPVKTLLEEIQHTFTTSEANHAQLHLKFAATRLGEVASLLAAERYDDISMAMSNFETEMREALWVLADLAGEEQPHVWALESLLTQNFENHTDALNDLVHRAPDNAQPAIDYAINVLVEETEALRALIHEMTPDSPPGGVVDVVPMVEPASSTGGSSDEDTGDGSSPAGGPDNPEPTAIPVAASTSTMFAQGSIGALQATRRALETQIALPTLLSTFWVTPTQVSPPHGGASETPTRTPIPFPHP